MTLFVNVPIVFSALFAITTTWNNYLLAFREQWLNHAFLSIVGFVCKHATSLDTG